MKPELLERHAALVEQTKETQVEREIRAMEAALGLDTYINRMIEAGAQALTPQQIQREVGWGGYQNIGPHLSLADDYMSGQCKPWYQNEMDLQEIRGIGRWLAGSDETATCVLRNIKHYTIGEGFTISVTSRDGMGAEQLATQVQAFIDEFMEANEFTDDGESEVLASSVIDGELLLWLTFRGYDPPKIRFVGGEQITEPGDARAIEDYLGMPGLCWKFGVATDQGNCENVHGYFVDWFGRGSSWDFIPESESVFIKRNVPRLCKRGISDFYVPFKRLDRGAKLFDSAVLGATIQASIAYIKEHAAGTPEASLTSALNSRLTQQVNVMRSDGQIESVTGENHFGGKVINVAGTKYHAGPMGTPQGPTYMEIYQAVTRRVGSRWCMPEYMISSDASNSNYASTLVAESPFILAIKDEQGALGRKIKQLIWKAIQMVANAGRFPMPVHEMQGLIEIKVEAPSPESRDPVKEEQVRDSQQNAGILSKKTRATQSGLDYDQEQANIAGEPQQAAPMMPGQPQAAIPGQPQQLALPNYPGTEGEDRTVFLAAKAMNVLMENCGANAPGGGGFQPGNTCGGGGGGGRPRRVKKGMSGEYWLDGGLALFADGDIGDFNHEGLAMAEAQREMIDEISGHLDDFDTSPFTDDEFIDWDGFEDALKAELDGEDVDEWIAEKGIDQNTFLVAQGFGDPRLWAAAKHGWIRVAGNDVQMVGISKERLSDLADGLADAYGDNLEDDEAFDIEVVDAESAMPGKTVQSKTYSDVPYSVIAEGGMSELRDYLFEHLGAGDYEATESDNCGANAPGGGGFQPGNDCARGNGGGGGGSAGKQYVNKTPKTAAELSGKVPQEDGKPVRAKSFTGYHVTKRENLESILKNGFDLSKAKPRFLNDLAVSMTTTDKAAKKWFTKNVKGAEFDSKKYAVVEVKFKGRKLGESNIMGMGVGTNDPRTYSKTVMRNGYDLRGGSVMYLYNTKAIASIREVE